MAQTVEHLQDIWVQDIQPLGLGFYICDCPKREVGVKNYFNGGFFATLASGGTVPVGNLADSGVIYAQAKDNESWINLSGKQLTTLIVRETGAAEFVKTDTLDTIDQLRTAVSGIPIIRDGKRVTMEAIRAEGYFGDELYDTWHGFLGIRGGRLVYVAAECGFDQMVWILAALGIDNAVKLDGGGSFILHNETTLAATEGDRRINNAGMWN